jgi:anti-sigma factor RsiW
MTGDHVHELDLLALSEGELPRADRDALQAHLDGCPECAASLRELEAGRAALRGAGRLELPRERRDAIVAAVGTTRGPEREPRFAHRRLAAVLAAAVVVGGVAAGVVVTGLEAPSLSGGKANMSTSAGAADAGGEAAPTARADLRKVAGPASSVARELRARGYDATVRDGEVHIRVTSGVPPALLEYLRTLTAGPVAVIADSD